MRLSEAIRLGATLRPQYVGGYFDSANTKLAGSCALGAAGEAVGLLPKWYEGEFDYWLEQEFPILLAEIFVPTAANQTVHGAIVDRNDTLGWTREQIADWVATIEAEEMREACVREAVEVGG